MRVLEAEAKTLLANIGVSIPQGQIITSPREAGLAAQEYGRPVVLKVQIPIGRRMKAGGIRFVDTPSEAVAAATDLLDLKIHGFPVTYVLVEEKIDIISEIFVGATYDSSTRTAVFVASLAGGIDVEGGTEIVRRPFSMLLPIPEYLGREIAGELGFDGSHFSTLSNLINHVIQCFVEWNALLLELNPLVLDKKGYWRAADVHLELDDDAAFRYESLLQHLSISMEANKPQTEFERQAADIDSADHRGVAGRLVPFDGNLGLLIGGGGASLTIMDALFDAGLKPANYCEIGGNPSVWKVKELTKLILSQPRVNRLAVIMNVVNNTRVDLVARGVVKGVLELDRDPKEAIIVFRIPGSWEEEGKSIMQHYGVPFFGRESSIDQVIEGIRWQSW